ncbi:hypothetical protein DRQ50_02410 [bacterium]|nr:MAG: hypothetical protein DRQ50_02410 [bacterium]
MFGKAVRQVQVAHFPCGMKITPAQSQAGFQDQVAGCPQVGTPIAESEGFGAQALEIAGRGQDQGLLQ